MGDAANEIPLSQTSLTKEINNEDTAIPNTLSGLAIQPGQNIIYKTPGIHQRLSYQNLVVRQLNGLIFEILLNR